MTVFAKDAQSTTDYSLNWSSILQPSEGLSSVAWSVFPEEEQGLTITDQGGSGALQGVIVSGGVPGHLYRLSCTVGTSTGRQIVRTLALRVLET